MTNQNDINVKYHGPFSVFVLMNLVSLTLKCK